MGQLLVRNLDDDIIEMLKANAMERGTSLEQVAREALAEAARRSNRAAWVAEMDRMRAETRYDPNWDSVAEIRKSRDELAARLDPDRLKSLGGTGRP